MVSWIWFFTQIAQKRQVEAPDDIFNSYGSVKGLVLLVIRLISLLAFPQTFLNFISLLIFETFQSKVKLRISVQSAPFFVIRIVTRGLYPKLVENNVKRNLDTILSVGCENFAIEVVTDTALNLPIYNTSQRVREIHVPKDYKTSTGALNKSRALQYCWEDSVNLYSDEEWIVHLDEETLVTDESIKGILNFINDDKHSVGQGMITYASEPPQFKSIWSTLQNRICTVADSFRVTEDLGKIRGQFQLLHKPIFGMKGSYVVTKVGAEKKVSFDNGLNGSIAEDAYFAIKAMDMGFTFDFIEGEMREKSPFSFSDFIKQRKRWMQGIYLVAFDSKLSINSRFWLALSIIAWITIPFATSNVFLGKIYPMKLWSIVDFSINFTGGMALYLYAFGFVKQHNIRRFSFLRLLFVIPELILASIVSIICEHIAVMTMWFGNWYEFYIVQKETEETDQQENEKEAIKMNGCSCD